MKSLKTPWNHNYAYNRWISKKVGKRKNILDVGCGNGTLSLFLRTEDNAVLGIDPSGLCIQKAVGQNTNSNAAFLQTTFEDFQANGQKFDAVIFVASIHHMNMADAVDKAKELLEKNGVLIIVGIAKPSGLLDWMVEAARVIPSRIISSVRQMSTSEELEMDVSYDFPTMNEVRQICGEKLCGYTLRYGLHYRYLLTWENS